MLIFTATIMFYPYLLYYDNLELLEPISFDTFTLLLTGILL